MNSELGYFSKSESITAIAKALSVFQSEVGDAPKDAVNPFFNSKYATLSSIIHTVKPILGRHGLSYSQFPTGENELTTVLMHESGEWLMGTAKMSPKDTSPQAQGSAITYLRRYALGGILGIATEEDDDGNVASALGKKPASVSRVPSKTTKNTQTTPSVPAEHPLKRRIWDKAQLLGLKTKEAIEEKMSLPLTESNYQTIFSRLEILEAEMPEPFKS